MIELALDEGQIHAAGRKLPVCELELELVEGNLSNLLMLGAHGERAGACRSQVPARRRDGFRLASGELYGPAVGA